MKPAQKKKLRLDRLLANLGYGSRKEVHKLVKHGLVTFDGVPCERADDDITITPDLRERLRVDGEELDPLPGLVILMHKPVGVVCSHKEGEGELVYDLLPARWRSREPAVTTVGRLDKDTSGLLLLTDDGALVHKLISPRSEIPKRYRAELDRPLRGDEAKIFASGTLMLESETKPLLPAKLEVHSPTSVTVAITEGRYHQVRRMFAATGNHVNGLHRLSIGDLELPEDLEPGEYMLLPEGALESLLK